MSGNSFLDGFFDSAVMEGLAVLIGAALVVVIWAAITHNRIVNLQNLISESWSNVGTELRRRYDLIPNLVEAVKGYAAHEQSVYETVARARERAFSSTDILPAGAAQAQAIEENHLVHALRQLLMISEAYPDLKADTSFLGLQKELINTEDRIQASRRFFNANVRDYNNLLQAFPTSMIAGLRGCSPHSYYELDELCVAPPDVSFHTPAPVP